MPDFELSRGVLDKFVCQRLWILHIGRLGIGGGSVTATRVDGSKLQVHGNTEATAAAVGVGLIKNNLVTKLE